MEVTIQNLSEVSRQVDITATAKELEPHFDKAYDQYRKKIEIRGFRKGKAPLDIIKKLYGEMIEHEALETIASEFYRQAVKEKDLKPIGEPTLVDLDFKRNDHVLFKISYDIRPQITLKEYKGIELEKPVHTVSDKEVEDEILRLRRSNGTFQEADAVLDAEYIVTANMQDLDDAGTAVVDRKSDGVRFYLADENLEQPFKDALKNAKKDGTYRLQFEHQHGDHKHTVNTELHVTKIEKIVLPEFDNAFIEKITKGKVKNVDQFRSDLRKDLEVYWKQQDERQLVNALTAELVKRHEFQVPESLTRSVLVRLVGEMKENYPDKKLPDNFDVVKFNEENTPYAVYQSKWALLREELIKAEHVEVTDQDLERMAEEEAERIKIPKERLINYYKSSEQIKDRIVDDKLMKLLIDSAKIKEIPQQK